MKSNWHNGTFYVASVKRRLRGSAVARSWDCFGSCRVDLGKAARDCGRSSEPARSPMQRIADIVRRLVTVPGQPSAVACQRQLPGTTAAHACAICGKGAATRRSRHPQIPARVLGRPKPAYPAYRQFPRREAGAELLVLDETTSALDASVQRQLPALFDTTQQPYTCE